MEVLPYVVVEFTAIYSESCVSQLGDLANGCVIAVFMNIKKPKRVNFKLSYFEVLAQQRLV